MAKQPNKKLKKELTKSLYSNNVYSDGKESKFSFSKMNILLPLLFILIGFYMFSTMSIIKVSGISMTNTLKNGDLVVRNVFKPNKSVGEIVTIERRADDQHPKDYTIVKRIVATPKDTIKITKDNVLINGKKLKEDYLSQDFNYNPETYNFNYLKEEKNGDFVLEYTLKDDEYFVLGDNRDNSRDSRQIGAVPGQAISGSMVIDASNNLSKVAIRTIQYLILFSGLLVISKIVTVISTKVRKKS